MNGENISITTIKIGLLGDSSVGKTAICNSFLNMEFNDDMLSTIGLEKLETKYKLHDGNTIKLILWDISGQERSRSIALKSIKAVQGVVIVFDVTKKKSFENINLWLEIIKENFQNPCLVLFGNKADMEKEKWVITSEEAKKFANSKKLLYYETSAKTKQGIDEGFSYIANETYKKVKEKKGGNINIEEPPIKEKSGCFGKKKSKKSGNKKKQKK